MEQDSEGMYILMEYVSGVTLDKKLDAAPEYFCQRRNLDKFFHQLLDALKHLHEHHVLFSDMKPQNIMLTRINNDMKIVDLGFCNIDAYSHTSGCTTDFSAPEQRSGRTETLDIRTDIYAVGKIMEHVENCTGKKLPPLYQKIMARCLEEDADKRFSNTEQNINLLDRRKRRIKRTVIAVALSVIILAPIYSFVRRTAPVSRFEEYVL